MSHLSYQGYLVDWDAQKAIWDGIFSNQVLNVNIHVLRHPFPFRSPVGQIDTAEASLLITEPYFNLPNIQEVYDQFVFEEYEFQSYFCSTRMFHLPILVRKQQGIDPYPALCVCSCGSDPIWSAILGP